MTMKSRTTPATAVDTTPLDEANIFRTALRLIGQGFVEIAQGIGLIAEGTLRPVRSLVPSLVVLSSIAVLTTTVLVLVVTTVAHIGLPIGHDSAAEATWTRWNTNTEPHFGNNTLHSTDLERLAETEAWAQDSGETAYAALGLLDR